MFGNPVAGVIRPPGSPLQVGSFRVTSTFAEHVAGGRGPGIDLGDGKCGSEILAMGRGRVTAAYRETTGAYVVRYALLDFPGYEAGLAHMPSLETAVGVTFARGAVLGHIGKSGATACHLHQGMKFNGAEIDWWPLLDQNAPPHVPDARDVLLAERDAMVTALTAERNALRAKIAAAQAALE